MSEAKPGATNALPPAFYFKSLERLWEEKRPRIEEHPWKETSVKGGILDAAVFFADMSGFSKLTSTFEHAPHAAAFVAHHNFLLLENWCRSVATAVNRAYIDKVIGDAVMLVIPGAKRQAVLDALTLASILLCQPIYPGKVGIHWGPVWLGNIGLKAEQNRHEEFGVVSVFGQTVNLASRLVAKAKPREVWILPEVLDGSPNVRTARGRANLVKYLWDPAGKEMSLTFDVGVARAKLKGISARPVTIARLAQQHSIGPVPSRESLVARYIEAVGELPRLD